MKTKIFRALLVTILVSIILFIEYLIFRGEYLEYLEIGKNYTNVFYINLKEKIYIFIFAFLISFIEIKIINLKMIRNLKVKMKEKNESTKKMPNNSLAFIFSFIFAIFAINTFKGEILRILNIASFGLKEEIFGLDYNIFITAIPIIHRILLFFVGFQVLLMIYISLYNIYYINTKLGGIEFDEFKDSAMLKQIVNLLVVSAILILIYNLLLQPQILVGDMIKRKGFLQNYLTGAGFTDLTVKLWGQRILLVVLFIALLKFKSGFKEKNSTKILNAILIVPISIVTLFIVEIIFELLIVRTNFISLQKNSIIKNQKATCESYDIKLNKFSVKKDKQLTYDDIRKNSEVIKRTPIITEDIAKLNLKVRDKNSEIYEYSYIIPKESSKGIKYFTPREIDNKKLISIPSKLSKYTHGNYGYIQSSNEFDDFGYVKVEDDKFENQIFDGKKITQPRIYYGMNTNLPAIISKEDKKEYDFPKTKIEEVNNKYDGRGGIKLNLIDKIALTIRKPIMLFTLGANEEKILLNRNIYKRIQKILPLSQVSYDEDPYLVIDKDGRLKWVIDGYTTTNRFPYSQKIPLNTKDGRIRINYIKNSFKVIVDAYNGDVTFYLVNNNDPLIRTIKNIYKDLFVNKEEMPKEIVNQLKYPKRLYNIQSRLIAMYHDNNEEILLNGEDDFIISTDKKNNQSNKEYSTILTYKNEHGEFKNGRFTAYTLAQRNTINSYLISEANGFDNYLKLYRFENNQNLLSLNFIKSEIGKDMRIQKEIDSLKLLGTQIITSQILIPIENTLLYVQPVYQIFLNEKPYPILKKVIVVNGNRVAIADNFELALEQLFGRESIILESLRDPQNKELLLNAIIKANDKLKDSAKKQDFNLMGKDINRLMNLIDKLKEKNKFVPENSYNRSSDNINKNKKKENE